MSTAKFHIDEVVVQPTGPDRWFHLWSIFRSERWQVRYIAKRIAESRGYPPGAKVPEDAVSFGWGGRTYMILSGKGEVREI